MFTSFHVLFAAPLGIFATLQARAAEFTAQVNEQRRAKKAQKSTGAVE